MTTTHASGQPLICYCALLNIIFQAWKSRLVRFVRSYFMRTGALCLRFYHCKQNREMAKRILHRSLKMHISRNTCSSLDYLQSYRCVNTPSCRNIAGKIKTISASATHFSRVAGWCGIWVFLVAESNLKGSDSVDSDTTRIALQELDVKCCCVVACLLETQLTS